MLSTGRLPKYDTIPHEVMTVPWDAKQDRPLCVSDARNPLHWYFLRVANHFWLLLGALLVAVLLAAVLRRRPLPCSSPFLPSRSWFLTARRRAIW